MKYIIGREGNQKTLIQDKSVSRQHLEVTPLGDGRYHIKNIGRNGTKVNGLSIDETTVEATTPLQLGASYKTTLQQLLQLPKPPETVDISHLESIYKRFTTDKARLRRDQMKPTYYRYLATASLPFIGLLTILFKELFKGFEYINTILIVSVSILVPIGIGLLIYSISIQKRITQEVPERENALINKFKIEYICPKCKKFLGDQPVEALRKQGKCPYCQTKWK